MSLIELSVNRDLTKWFIDQDPTTVTLTPQTRVKTASGAFTLSPGVPRAPQIVKLIFTAGTSDGISDGNDGKIRKYDFILLGEWNCAVETNDFWEDTSGNFWIVTGISPENGYERKVMVSSYGGHPQNG